MSHGRIALSVLLLLLPLSGFGQLVFRGPWSGGVTTTSAVVKARLRSEGITARLLLSTFPDLREPVWTKKERAYSNQHNIVTFQLAGLVPNTVYYYALEVNQTVDLLRRGKFMTFPEGAASFTFAFASCARTASSNKVFTTILQNQPLFYMNVGDFHYQNIQSNQIALYREAYDQVLSSPTQSLLYRYVPFVYMWDDHDFGGNASTRWAQSHQAARLAYQEYVPHYPLEAGRGDVPIYQAFTVGRVRFILTDLRSERSSIKAEDDASKSMLGPTQKKWFKDQLLDARGKYPLIFWVSTVPWIGDKNFEPAVPENHFGFYHHKSIPARALIAAGSYTNRATRTGSGDHWATYSRERRELADFFRSQNIQGLCILHGDAHMLAADDGRFADYATDAGGPPIRVLCGAPLDQNSSAKGGPYSQGIYKPRPGEGCFGRVDVMDLGEKVVVQYSGRNQANEEKVALRFEVPGK